MPGQNPVVAEHYQDQFHTISFPLTSNTITRGAITPLLYVEKRQIVVDDVRLITRKGDTSLTIDVGFLPGAAPTGATWNGTYVTTSNNSVSITLTTSGSLSVGDRLVNIDGSVLTGIPAGTYISSFGTYTAAAGTGTITISANASTSATYTGTGYANGFDSVLTAPMSAATDNTMVVGAINSNQSTVPTSAPNSLAVTTPNNIVPGPTTSGSTTVLGSVLCIEARGATVSNYVGTLQIRYRERLG